jgi:hypothetical protein
MAHSEYLIIRRSGQWWVTLDGERTGPFGSQNVAVDAAVYRARLDFKAGNTARVSVDEPGDGIPVVFETAQDTSR